jgi:hypothetical protein
MICILAGNREEARRFAAGQFWESHEWFYPENIGDLFQHSNFHVLVVGTAGQNVSSTYFEKVYNLARQRGRMKMNGASI